MVFSAALAPIRMLFQTQFVIAGLTGLGVAWKSPPRKDAETTWGTALRRHGLHTLLGAAWAGTIYWLEPSYVWWLLPVVGALVLSIPISVCSSRVSLGRALRRVRLFLIPEESDPPIELRSVWAHLDRVDAPPRFVDAVTDPLVNAIACAASVPRPRRASGIQSRRDRILVTALEGGPGSLTDAQKLFLLTDPAALSQLHAHVCTSSTAHPSWRVARVPGALAGGAPLREAS